MKRGLAVVVAASCALMLGLSAVAVAELTPGQKQAVEALIKQFSAKEFALRQAAVNRLIEIGPDVVPLIKQTLAETMDNEVKLRCEMVLKGIKEKFGDKAVDETKPAETKPAAPVPTSRDASKITLAVKDTSVSEVLQKLAEQSGNALVGLPQNWEDKTVTLNLKDMLYWQALDEVCKSAGLVYDVPQGGGGGGRAAAAPVGFIALHPAPKTPDVTAYSGPVAVKLTRVQKERFYRVALPDPNNPAFECQLTYFWEDRLPVISASGRITKMTAGNGAELNLPAPADAGAGPQRFGNFGVRGRSCSGRILVSLADVPDKLDKLNELSGVVTLDVGTGEKQITLADALAEGEKNASAGDVTLTVTRVNKRNDSASLTAKLTQGGKDLPAPAYAAGSNYGFFLVSADGKKIRGTSYSNAGGGRGGFFGRGRGGRGGNAPGQPDAPAGEFTIQFLNLPAGEGASLVYVFPEKTVSKEYEFKITNVPLP